MPLNRKPTSPSLTVRLTEEAAVEESRTMTLEEINDGLVRINSWARTAVLDLEKSDLPPKPPGMLTRQQTIRPVKPSDYLTPRRSGRAKKKYKTAHPPPAPRMRPVPRDLSTIEVIDLTEKDAKIVYDLTGSPIKYKNKAMGMAHFNYLNETPGRVTKTEDGDVVVEIDGVAMSMAAIFGDAVLGHDD